MLTINIETLALHLNVNEVSQINVGNNQQHTNVNSGCNGSCIVFKSCIEAFQEELRLLKQIIESKN